MRKLRKRMPKQRCLLIILISLMAGSLSARVHLESVGYGIVSRDKPAYINRTTLDADHYALPNLQVSYSMKLDAGDKYIDEFPAKKTFNNVMKARFTQPAWFAESSYRSTLYGDSQTINLYPKWNEDLGNEYRGKSQHQGYVNLGANAQSVSAEAYISGKILIANPITYTYDSGTDTMIPSELDSRSYEDLYYGAELKVQPLPYLSISANADLKQANFDNSNLYNVNSLGLRGSSELKLGDGTRLTAYVDWQNRDGANLPPETRNLFQNYVRFQQRLGTQLNGYVSFISNGCAGSKLSQLYLISNQVRTHLKLNISYDETGESYLLVGAKYSPQHKSSALFADEQFRLYKGLYSYVGLSLHPDLTNVYQTKLSYYFNPMSSLFMSYQASDSQLSNEYYHFLGIGTSLYY